MQAPKWYEGGMRPVDPYNPRHPGIWGGFNPSRYPGPRGDARGMDQGPRGMGALDFLRNARQGAQSWWQDNKPQLTMTSKGFYEDGTPALNSDGGQMERVKNFNLRSPFRNPFELESEEYR